MKKVLSLLLVLSLVAALFAGCAKEEEKTTTTEKTETKTETKTEAKEEAKEEAVEQMVFRLAETHPGDYPTTLGDMEFARLVEEKTEGRIKIEVYHSKQLGEEKDVIEQVQFGAIDFTRVSVGPMTEFSPELAVVALPYMYSGADHMWKVLNSSIGDDFLAGLESSNFVGLCWYDGGARSFYNSVRPIESLEDLAGLKFRVMQSELMVDMVEALGASPTPMAYGEVYSSIQTNVIDGAENNWPSYDTSSHYEVAKYYTLDEHLRVPEILIASKIVMDKVSPEDMALIKEAAKESQDFQIAKWKAKEEESEKKIREAGNEIVELSAEVKQTFADRMKPVWAKHADGYGHIIDEIQAMK
jgi:tripartite ATP-independent transporter DctP family solute receptor